MFNTLNNEMHVPSEVMEEAEQKIKSTTWMILINRLFFYRATTVMADLSNINFEVMDEMVTNESDIRTSFERALHPNHAAISLDGEPTLYPFIGELVNTFRKKKFTTFIVTNGTTPEVIDKLRDSNNLPSILYVTLPPPTQEAYKKIHRPKIKAAWEKIQTTLNGLKNLPNRTVLRISLLIRH